MEGYEMYKKLKRQRKEEAEKRAAAILEGIGSEMKLRKVSLDDFPNYKRKLVV